MKDDTQQEIILQAQGETNVSPRKKMSIKVGVSVAVLVAVICAVGGIVTYELWRNSPATVLLESIQHTASQKELKFDVEIQLSRSAAIGQNSISVHDAKYKSGSGLSANITSGFTSGYGETIIKSSWAIPSDNSLYASHVSSELKLSDAGKQLASQYGASVNVLSRLSSMLNRDVGKWSKLGATSDSVGFGYGLDPCVLSTTYNTLSHQEELRMLLKELSGLKGLSVIKNGASYVVDMESKTRGDASTLYKNSFIYKSLHKCNQSDFGAAQGALGDILSDSQLKFEIDHDNIVKKATFTSKNGAVITINISTAKNVSIMIPEITPVEPLKQGETPEQYLQRTRPFVYKHLEGLSDPANGPL